MLVLARRPTQEIIITTSDGPIVVSVQTVRGQAVKLGFEAPDNVRIFRKEVLEAAPTR